MTAEGLSRASSTWLSIDGTCERALRAPAGAALGPRGQLHLWSEDANKRIRRISSFTSQTSSTLPRRTSRPRRVRPLPTKQCKVSEIWVRDSPLLTDSFASFHYSLRSGHKDVLNSRQPRKAPSCQILEGKKGRRGQVLGGEISKRCQERGQRQTVSSHSSNHSPRPSGVTSHRDF